MNDALLPELSHKHPMFWASQAINQHTLHAHLSSIMRASADTDFVTLVALASGAGAIKRNAENCFENARQDGVLLHAWPGSTSLTAESVEVAA